MRWNRADVGLAKGRARRSAVATLLMACMVAAAGASTQNRSDRRAQDRLEDVQRKEGEALIRLADAAMAGHASSDFSIGWRNDFFKAQIGTFVPFTVTIDRSSLTAAHALMYVRAARRDSGARANEAAGRFPFDIVFPVALSAPAGQPVRITRGFAVAPGDYDVYVALRERPADPLNSDRRLKGAVLKQPLTVPDFWTGELATSTVMLADRIDEVAPVSGDDVLERPYVIGTSEIHPATTASFGRNRELIVVFLIYNPAVAPDGNFDIEVNYHLFRRDGAAPAERDGESHPPARPGERYVTRTPPQHFKPSVMGASFDPVTGPILAGQGILLSSFQDGDYRLGITVTDVTSRHSLTRDVTFSVAGS
jgi:hypothetical protein